MSSQSQNYVTETTLQTTGICMIVLASVAFLARCVARATARRWQPQPEDIFVGLAWVCYTGMSISYTVILPAVYRIAAYETGKIGPYAGLLSDAEVEIKVFFANTTLLWATLWSIKLAFLMLYRKLMNGLPHYIRWWWAILIFCLVTFAVAIVTNITSCANMHQWFTPGLCETHHDIEMQIMSLYYAYAVDVVTDLMIMILPIQLIWNLQMKLWEKVGIGATFAVGTLSIVASTVRVVSIGSKSGNDSTPSSTWLALWGMVEGAIVIVAACLPEFAIFLRRKGLTRRGYAYENGPSSGNSRRPGEVQLATIGSGPRRTQLHSDWDAISESEENILRKPSAISVVRTTNVDYGHREESL